MPELANLEIFLRGGAIATLLICAAIFALPPPFRRKEGSVAALCLALCAYMAVSSPGLGFETGLTFVLLAAVAAAVPVLIYWVALELFQDDQHFAGWQLFTCALIIAASWLSFTSVSVGILRGAGVIVIFSHLVGVIIAGDQGDLIEARRHFRRWFLLAIAAVAMVITALEITGWDRGLPVGFYLLHAVLVWCLAAVFLIWSVRVDPTLWMVKRQSTPSEVSHSPAQRALIARINTAMSNNLWEREGLTLSQMAQELGTQDHRLRSAINQAMGHRNFSSFINGYRIERAKSLLSDPDAADRTVLSIAYDVGFASLGPFNRAFRDATATTPTAFRQAALRSDDSAGKG